MPPAARPVTAVSFSSVTTAPYSAGNITARTGRGAVIRTAVSGSAIAAYIRTAWAAIIVLSAVRDNDGKKAVATPPARKSGTRARAALAW